MLAITHTFAPEQTLCSPLPAGLELDLDAVFSSRNARRRTCPRRPDANPAGYSGSAKTNRLLPLLGRNSGVSRRKLGVVAALPVPTATYWRPPTA